MTYSAKGWIVVSGRGIPTWTGNPERTRNPRIIVYDNRASAERAAKRLQRSNDNDGWQSAETYKAARYVLDPFPETGELTP